MLKAHMSVICRSPLFSGIKTEELEQLLNKCFHAKIQTYARGEVIAHREAPVEFFVLPLKGRIAIVSERSSGERIIDIMREGVPYGPISYYSGAKRWIVTLEVLADSVALLIPHDIITNPCSKSCGMHVKLTENMLGIVSCSAMQLDLRLNLLSYKGIRERIVYYLLTQSSLNGSLRFCLPLNRNEMADYLNVSRPSMSRELSEMKSEGLIDYHKNNITIIKPDLLAKMTGEYPLKPRE